MRAPNRLTWLILAAIAVLVAGVGTALAQSSATAGWPADKAQLYQHEQQALAQARLHPRPKVPSAGLAPAAQPAPTRQAGIIAMRQGPFPATSFLVRNVWQGPIGSEWILVYAGAERNPTSDAQPSGALRLYTESADMHLSQIGTFLAPAGTGPLTITGVTGDVLSARSDSGAMLSFDLQTHQFLATPALTPGALLRRANAG